MNTITYFGYGANESEDMMEAIIGRKPTGAPATLENYELIIQQSSEMTDEIKKLLANFRSAEEVAEFSTYAIRPKKGSTVKGMAWQISQPERELVDNWEMNDGFWYLKTDVVVKTTNGNINASTEIMEDPTISPAAKINPALPVFLNSKNRMLEVAEKVREAYLKDSKITAK